MFEKEIGGCRKVMRRQKSLRTGLRRDKARAEFFVADMFSGAGGLTAGFRARGFVPKVAVEADFHAARSYAANFGDHVFACPIEFVDVVRLREGLRWEGVGLDGKRLTIKTPQIDVLVGGPPCQGFSPLGRMVERDRVDPRNDLWRHYVRILEIVAPQVFVLENVPELLKSDEFTALLQHFERSETRFEITSGLLNAKDFGVPQSRRRAIVIGSRRGRPFLPAATNSEKTVRDAIGGLSSEPDGINLHVARTPWPSSVERYRTIPAGGNRFDLVAKRPDLAPPCWIKKSTGSTDVFGRMIWDAPAPTIRTEFFKPEKGRYLHPEAHRAITVREAARLQTFPDDFTFCGPNVQIAKQIGNAVPVLFAAEIASAVSALLLDANPTLSGSYRSPASLDREIDFLDEVRAAEGSTLGRPRPSSPAVSRRMQSVKRRDTGCELSVRKLLHAYGLRYRIDAQPIVGARVRADILFRSQQIAIFIDGCFWHGCECKTSRPKANADWWAAKLSMNQDRDRRLSEVLRISGWRVLRFWEHEDAHDVAQVIIAVVESLSGA